ncbi:MAG: hypothetical protein WCE51_09035 [Chthoniobacterales bacterium]|jgi:hypothetical protein
MNERDFRCWTPHLSREFEMLAFGNGGGLPLIFPKGVQHCLNDRKWCGARLNFWCGKLPDYLSTI